MPDSISRAEFQRFESNLNGKLDTLISGQDEQRKLNITFNERAIRSEFTSEESERQILENSHNISELIKKAQENQPIIDKFKDFTKRHSAITMAFFLSFATAAGGGTWLLITDKPPVVEKKVEK